MDVRHATDQDIPRIVELLKASLGESFLPKSVAYWHWKHIANPFGRSPVLVATEGDQLIGVRAFMRWRWEGHSGSREAVRAVDTATHPDHQGKGIFTKLTKALLEECAASNISLVYNTPNEKSMPGYLKMGWKKAGNLPIDVSVVNPFEMFFNITGMRKEDKMPHSDGSVNSLLSHPGLRALLLSAGNDQSAFHTPLSVDYLRWRYVDIPVAHYFAIAVAEGSKLSAAAIYRMKRTRWGRQLRICDAFVRSWADQKKLSRLIAEKARTHGASMMTAAGTTGERVINGVLSGRSKKLGPIVTIRSILQTDLSDFEGFTNWSPSLGDMELF